MAGLEYNCLNERNMNFMRSLDPSLLSKRRETFSVQLRRDRRLCEIDHRRKGKISKDVQIPSVLLQICPNIGDPTIEISFKLSLLKNLIAQGDSDVYYAALTYFRKLCNIHTAAFYVEYIPFIIQAAISNTEKFVYEATWMMCNISAGISTRVLIENNLIPILKSLINTTNEEIIMLCVKCMGNIASEFPSEANFSMELINLSLRVSHNTKIMYIIVWALTKISKGNGSYIDSLILYKKLLSVRNVKLAVCVMNGLLEIGRKGNEAIKTILDMGIPRKLVNILKNNNTERILEPCIRLIGTISSSNFSSELVGMNLLDSMVPLVSSNNPSIRKWTYWTLSNLGANNPYDTSAIVSHPVMKEALKALNDEVEAVRIEASFVFRNLCRLGSVSSLMNLYYYGTLSCLSAGLSNDKNTDTQYLANCLCAVSCILSSSKNGFGNERRFEEDLKEKYGEDGLVDGIAKLLDHPNQIVSEQARSILNNHFDEFAVQGDSTQEVVRSFKF